MWWTFSTDFWLYRLNIGFTNRQEISWWCWWDPLGEYVSVQTAEDRPTLSPPPGNDYTNFGLLVCLREQNETCWLAGSSPLWHNRLTSCQFAVGRSRLRGNFPRTRGIWWPCQAGQGRFGTSSQPPTLSVSDGGAGHLSVCADKNKQTSAPRATKDQFLAQLSNSVVR